MSVCWNIVCDDLEETLWCGQNEYLYTGEPETMKDLSAFLFHTRGHNLRVTTDLTWGGPEQDYTEVGALHSNAWEITAVNNQTGEKMELGVFNGSRRQAYATAAAQHFPEVKYYEDVNVLANHYQLEARNTIRETV